MRLSRRWVLATGGFVLAGRIFPPTRAVAAAHDITMMGNADGSRVWFDPIGLLLRPGDAVRWTNRDPGNSHTSTAYHPANDAHPLRIPKDTAPWNSDYLLPDQTFSVTLTAAGVYDYFCIPHEHAGMVGRIVVMGEGEPPPQSVTGSPIAEIATDPFPPVANIVQVGQVRVR